MKQGRAGAGNDLGQTESGLGGAHSCVDRPIVIPWVQSSPPEAQLQDVGVAEFVHGTEALSRNTAASASSVKAQPLAGLPV